MMQAQHINIINLLFIFASRLVSRILPCVRNNRTYSHPDQYVVILTDAQRKVNQFLELFSFHEAISRS